MIRIELLDGKYAVLIADAGQISYERRGEGWPGARGYAMEFNQMVEPLARRVAELEAHLAGRDALLDSTEQELAEYQAEFEGPDTYVYVPPKRKSYAEMQMEAESFFSPKGL